MKLNTLRIEPHEAIPRDIQAWYDNREPIMLWRVWVDTWLVTETAHPFYWSDSVVQLKENLHHPYLGEGDGFVSVRSIGDYIVWLPLQLIDEAIIVIDGKQSHIVDNRIFVFDLNEYMVVCNAALAKTHHPYMTNHRNDPMQQILDDVRELQSLIDFPHGEHTIYRDRHNPDDPTGEGFYKRVHDAVKVMTEVDAVAPPSNTQTVQIGVDDMAFKVCTWHIGKANGRYAIYFEQYPHFPLWLQFDTLDAVIQQEPFADQL